MSSDLAVYIAEHYGKCAVEPRCRCRYNASRIQCVDWRPVSASNWQELREAMIKERQSDGEREHKGRTKKRNP